MICYYGTFPFNGASSPGMPPNGISFPGGLNYSDSGFRKFIPFLQSPPVGASIISLAVFFMIAFATDALFSSVNLINLGITVTLSVLAFIGLVILILFLL